MTNEERLAIAEEFVRFTHPLKLHDMDVTCWGDGNGDMYVAWNGKNKLIENRDVFCCIHLARQKLAAEREATMTPNERKYKTALNAIALACGEGSNVACKWSARIASEAIKES